MTHMLTRAVTLGAALAALTATAAPAAMGGGLMAMLNGASEKPTAGDPQGGGMAMVRPDVAKSQVCYDLQVRNLSPATMAHIHKAPADAAGPVAVPLAAPDASGKSSGCVAADPAVVKDIAANPAGYYVNVHTAQFPAGAIRGQLKK
ncbi:MAG: CHRD domain-containing protein [Phenylobacterium sp.]